MEKQSFLIILAYVQVREQASQYYIEDVLACTGMPCILLLEDYRM